MRRSLRMLYAYTVFVLTYLGNRVAGSFMHKCIFCFLPAVCADSANEEQRGGKRSKFCSEPTKDLIDSPSVLIISRLMRMEQL